MKKELLLLVIAAFMVVGILSPAVSAAGTADGYENIQSGDHVILGESGLNFSSFSSGGYTHMVLKQGDDIRNQFAISDSVTISYSFPEGRYYAYSFVAAHSSGDYCIITSGDNLPYAFYDSTGKNKLGTQIEGTVGSTFTFTLKGKPGVEYQIFKDDEMINSVFLNRETLETQLSVNLPSTPDQIEITVAPKSGSLVSDGPISFTINVVIGGGVTTDDSTILYINSPSADARNGLFATGDLISISGTLIPSLASDGKTVYLYLRGVNYPDSGVNLEGNAVVDGVEGSFTTTTYHASLNAWTAKWDTSGFEPGMYTVYATLEPFAYSAERLISGVEIKSQEYTLSDRSIHVKFAEENDGIFTQGDYLYAYWSARGSPSEVRWYIIGQNYMKTGKTAFPLYTADQKKGYDAPQGVYGFSYDRVDTTNMAAGTYYLLYQHPGFNDVFDVWPDYENGYFTALSTNFDESASLDGRPSANCAEVLQNLIRSVRSDDLCVITEIIIEEPMLTIDQVDNLDIGDPLKIKGTTNYAGPGITVDGTEVKDTFSLVVNRLDFDLAEENAAMKMQVVSHVTPQNAQDYGERRTYEFAEIDTSTWFEGTYQATVTNIDTGFSKSIMFTVGGEGVETDSSTIQVPADPLAEPYEELEPLPPIERHEEPTEPEEPKSPGFILAPIALGLAVILRRK